MIISCPSCDHETEVPDGVLPPSGARMKCPSCRSAFTALPSGFTVLLDPADAGVGSGPTMSGSPSASPAGGKSPPESGPFLTEMVPTGEDPYQTSPPSLGNSYISYVPGGGSPSSPRASEAPVLESGQSLGKYRIEGVLGRGAFGTVYRAFDPDLGERVAVKALGTFGDPEALREALAEEFKVQRQIKDKTHLLESYPPAQVEGHGLRWVLLPMELAEKTFGEWLKEKGGKGKHLGGSYPLNDLSIVASLRHLSWIGGVRRTGYKWGDTSRSRKAFS